MKPKQIFPLILLAVIWGCYYVASQQAVRGMSVFTVGIVIRFITMVLLLIVMGVRGQLPLLLKVDNILPRLIIIGVLGFLLDLTAFVGLTLSPAGTGTALLKCDIIFVNLISVIIYKRKFTKLDWLLSFIMLGGVFLVMGITPGNISLGGSGDIFFILSALFVSINAFVIKSVQTDKINPAEDDVIAFYNNFITMILFIVTAIVMGTMGQISRLSGDRGLLVATLLAGLGQFFIYQSYYYNLRRLMVWKVKIFLLLMPVVAALVSFILFGQTLTPNQTIGMAIVLLGALALMYEQLRKVEPASPPPQKID